MMGSIPEEFH